MKTPKYEFSMVNYDNHDIFSIKADYFVILGSRLNFIIENEIQIGSISRCEAHYPDGAKLMRIETHVLGPRVKRPFILMNIKPKKMKQK